MSSPSYCPASRGWRQSSCPGGCQHPGASLSRANQGQYLHGETSGPDQTSNREGYAGEEKDQVGRDTNLS